MWIRHYMISKIRADAPFRVKMNEEDFIREFKPILNKFGLDLSNTSSIDGFSIIEFNPEKLTSLETIDMSSDIEGTRQFLTDKIRGNEQFKVTMKEKYFDENFLTLINEMRAWELVSFEQEMVTIQRKRS